MIDMTDSEVNEVFLNLYYLPEERLETVTLADMPCSLSEEEFNLLKEKAKECKQRDQIRRDELRIAGKVSPQ